MAGSSIVLLLPDRLTAQLTSTEHENLKRAKQQERFTPFLPFPHLAAFPNSCQGGLL